LLLLLGRSPPSCPLILLPVRLSTDRLPMLDVLFVCPVGGLLRLLFVHICRVHWFRCPLSSLLIACSRLPMLDVLSDCPVGCLLLLRVRPHPPPRSPLIACSRLRPLSSPSGCPVARCCCSLTSVVSIGACCCPPSSLLITCSRLPMLDVLFVWLSC
jgi:hypothetical protein